MLHQWSGWLAKGPNHLTHKKKGRYLLSCALLHVRQNMAVSIQGKRGASVTQPF